MGHRKLAAVMALALCGSAVVSAGLPDYFHTDWDKAQKVAEEQSKPLYVHFTTEWCGWCRKIENNVYQSKTGEKALKPFVPVSLDCTKRGKKGEELEQAKANRKLMNKWGGSGFPSLFQVTADGTVFNSWSGYQPKDQFQKELDQAIASLEKYREFKDTAANKENKDYSFYVKAMNAYDAVQRREKAAAAARKVLKLDAENKRGNAAHAAMILFKNALDKGELGEAHTQLQKVKEFDPENQTNEWEKAAYKFALTSLKQGSSRGGGDNSRFKKPTSALQNLVNAEVELNNPQKDHHLLGFLQMKQGQNEKALKHLKKAIAANPDSDRAKKIKKLKEKVEKKK